MARLAGHRPMHWEINGSILGQGHISGLWAQSTVGGVQETANR